MRTGSPPRRGFTYLLLLFALALGGAALASAGRHWQTAAQREREAELLWRGLQIRDALQRYGRLGPPGTANRPRELAQLLVDHRQTPPRHWLRALYADPFTGHADWLLLRDAEGGITGVASRSRRPALRRHGLPEGLVPPDLAAPAVGDWQFSAADITTSTGRTP